MKRCRLNLVRSWALPVALVLGAGVARGLVLMEGTPLQKQRADVGKQVAKAIVCVAKAAIKCEKSGINSGTECDLANPGASTVPDPVAKQKFIDALATCESKLDLSKKSATGNSTSDYTGIGCPGDSDPNTSGDQPFANLDQLQASVVPGIEGQLAMIGPFIDSICGGPNSPDPTVIACVDTDAKALLKYGVSAGKCQSKCENDYNNVKGNGGPVDTTTQCALASGSADPIFQACEGVARAKLEMTGENPSGLDLILDGAGMTPGLNAALDAAINDLYNENDCP